MHEFTEFFLYSSFENKAEGGADLLFLRSILEKPHLGLYVTKLVSDGSGCFDKDHIVLGDHFHKRLASAIRHVSPDPELYEEWYRKVGGMPSCADWDAIVALLLCLCPNLQVLDWDLYGGPYPFVSIERVLIRAGQLQEASPSSVQNAQKSRVCRRYPPQPTLILRELAVFTNMETYVGWNIEDPLPSSDFSLSQLRAATIRYQGEGLAFVGMENYQILPFLVLSSISSFSCHMVIDVGLSKDLDLHNPHISRPITQLTFPLPDFSFKTHHFALNHSYIGSETLCKLLKYFTVLKNFSYSFDMGYEDEKHDGYDIEFIPVEIFRAINRFSGTLDKLSLIKDHFRKTSIDPTADLPLPSLQCFKKSRQIEASADVLLGRRQGTEYSEHQLHHIVGLFPNSLERLVVKHTDAGMGPVLKLFLANNLPAALKSVVLECLPDSLLSPIITLEERKMHSEMATSKGIELVFIEVGTCVQCDACFVE